MRKNFTLCFLVASILATTSSFAATFVVTSTADSGPGTLRDAIAQANATPGPDVITFNIALVPTAINLTSSLTITSSVLIDGYSNAGASQGPVNARQIMIGLNFSGPLVNVSPKVDAIVVNGAGDVTIGGLAMYGAARGLGLKGRPSVTGPRTIPAGRERTTETNRLGAAPFAA